MPEWRTLLELAIEASTDSAKELKDMKRARPDDSQIALLWEALSSVDKRELPLENLFPEGVPTDEQFFERLFQLRIALGFGQPEGEIVAIVASAAVGMLAEEDRSLILLGIADVIRRISEASGYRSSCPDDDSSKWGRSPRLARMPFLVAGNYDARQHSPHSFCSKRIKVGISTRFC